MRAFRLNPLNPLNPRIPSESILIMKHHLKSILALGIITLGSPSAQAGEQRLVGYANGKPLYVNGGPMVRSALPASQPMRVPSQARPPVRVNMGSSQCYHGPVANYSGFAPTFGWGMEATSIPPWLTEPMAIKAITKGLAVPPPRHATPHT